MKLAEDNNVMLSNAAANESLEFGVADMRIIMEVLTKLYANPRQTLTQEYISNARDAHREIGQKRQIEITAPTRFNAVMSIRDFGPGLSPDRIRKVFTLYGASTKRDTNSQTGGFGIGAKSAWSYTDSFLVTSYYNGTKSVFNAHKSKGIGSFDKISEETTTEPNGVCIEIAVSPMDVMSFRQAILRTIYFWKPSEKPLVKGIDASEIPDYKPKCTDIPGLITFQALPNFFSNAGGKSIIVVDGIPYPNRSYIPTSDRMIKNHYAVFLETGHVDIAPNREELIKDDKTSLYMAALDKRLAKAITDYVNKQVGNLANLKNCIKIAADLKNNFECTITYKGYHFNYHGITVTDPKDGKTTLTLGDSWYFHGYRTKQLKKRDFNEINYGEIDNVFYDDLPNEAAVRKVWRVRKTIEGTGNYFKLFDPSKVDNQIILDVGAKPLSSIDASDYKVQRQAKAAVKKLELCVHYFGGNLNAKQENISTITDTIVYALLDSDTYSERDNKKQKLIRFINSKTGYRFAFIAKGCAPKLKNATNFITLEDFIKTYKVTDAELKFHLKEKDYSCNAYEHYASMAGSLKDPAIVYFIQLAMFKPGNSVGTVALPDEMVDTTHKLVVEYHTHKKAIEAMDTRYPLFESFSRYSLTKANYAADVVCYLNAKYGELTNVQSQSNP